MTDRLPLFIVCANPRCAAVHPVRNRTDQRTIRFCGHRCASTVCRNLTRAGSRKGGQASATTRRRKLLASLEGLTPLQIFRVGYVRGLQSKYRQVQKGYRLVKAS